MGNASRDPMAWAGLFAVLGAASWPWWRPELPEVLAGVLAMGLLAIAARASPIGPAAWCAGALLAGAGAVVVRPEPAPLAPVAALMGEVVSTTVGTVVLETNAGRVRVATREEAAPAGTPDPFPGDVIAALTFPGRPRAALPGDPDAEAQDARARLLPRRAGAWVRLGPPPRAGPGFVEKGARHGALLEALATGRRGDVPDATTRLLRDTGTVHLLSISGLHLALVAGAAFTLVSLASRPLALLPSPWPARLVPALASLAAAIAYGGLVGWPVPARRAAWMVGAALCARLLARDVRPWNLLGIAACAVVLVEPGEVVSPSFLLSFGGVAGILLVSPRVLRVVPPDSPRLLRWLATAVATSLGAMAGTAPVSILFFQQFSLVSTPANLVAVPLIGGIATPAALVAAALPGDAGLLALAVADGATDLALGLLGFLHAAALAPAVGSVGALALASAVLLVRWPMAASGGAVLALCLRLAPADRLVVTFLSVGQGDAALVEWPDGRRWLVDGGPPSDLVLHYLRRRGIRRLDAVVLSHPHPDHLGGLLPVVRALDVDLLIAPRLPRADEPDFAAIWLELWHRGAAISGPDERMPLGVEAMHPRDGWTARGDDRVNEESLVLRLAYGAHSFLLTGDVGAQAESLLSRAARPATVVKVAHHGSRFSSTVPFVRAVHPDLAVVSCGPQNSYRHPAPAALARWAGVPLLRTDIDGTIEVSTDGIELRVRTWRAGTGWRSVDRAPIRPRPGRSVLAHFG